MATKAKTKIEVSKIVINVKDARLTLTVAEAKELMDALAEVVDRETKYIPAIPYPPYWPQPYRYWGPTWCSDDNTVRISYTATTSEETP